MSLATQYLRLDGTVALTAAPTLVTRPLYRAALAVTRVASDANTLLVHVALSDWDTAALTRLQDFVRASFNTAPALRLVLSLTAVRAGSVSLLAAVAPGSVSLPFSAPVLPGAMSDAVADVTAVNALDNGASAVFALNLGAAFTDVVFAQNTPMSLWFRIPAPAALADGESADTLTLSVRPALQDRVTSATRYQYLGCGSATAAYTAALTDEQTALSLTLLTATAVDAANSLFTAVLRTWRGSAVPEALCTFGTHAVITLRLAATAPLAFAASAAVANAGCNVTLTGDTVLSARCPCGALAAATGNSLELQLTGLFGSTTALPGAAMPANAVLVRVAVDNSSAVFATTMNAASTVSGVIADVTSSFSYTPLALTITPGADLSSATTLVVVATGRLSISPGAVLVRGVQLMFRSEGAFAGLDLSAAQTVSAADAAAAGGSDCALITATNSSVHIEVTRIVASATAVKCILTGLRLTAVVGSAALPTLYTLVPGALRLSLESSATVVDAAGSLALSPPPSGPAPVFHWRPLSLLRRVRRAVTNSARQYAYELRAYVYPTAPASVNETYTFSSVCSDVTIISGATGTLVRSSAMAVVSTDTTISVAVATSSIAAPADCLVMSFASAATAAPARSVTATTTAQTQLYDVQFAPYAIRMPGGDTRTRDKLAIMSFPWNLSF